MQMFGVGVLELLIILILTTIVVGPDKMPQLAADLGRWIRQTRAYAKHLMGDFNEVISELEKEAGASREDWKEIASVVTRHTGAVGQELTRFTREVEEQRDLAEIKALADQPDNVVSMDQDAVQAEIEEPEELDVIVEVPKNGNGAAEPEEDEESEKPWYVPERASRRRSE